MAKSFLVRCEPTLIAALSISPSQGESETGYLLTPYPHPPLLKTLGRRLICPISDDGNISQWLDMTESPLKEKKNKAVMDFEYTAHIAHCAESLNKHNI